MDYESLLENNIDERNRIKDEIKDLDEDIIKYKNRGDDSSAKQCFEKKQRLKSNLQDIESEINRLERIIKNNGIDPYAPVPLSDSPNKPTNLPIDDGTITSTMTMDIEFMGTKGNGDNKQDVYQTHTQTVERDSEIKNGEIVNQVSNVNTVSSRKTQKNLINNSSRNLLNSKNVISTNKKSTNSFNPKERYEKNKMRLFISNLKNGKTWDQAAALSQISSTAASKWYQEGSKNLSKNTRYFYNEIKYLENHNKLNKNNVKIEKVKNNSRTNNVNSNERKKMNSFLNYLRKGLSWEESAKLANIFPIQATTWYRWGSKNFTENTFYFYNQLNKLNISSEKIFSPKTADEKSVVKKKDNDIIDVKVINDEKNVFDVQTVNNKKKTVDDKKTIITDEKLIDDKKSKMNLIIFNLKEGNSLEKCSKIAGISIDIINGWIIKGKNSNIEYVDFYNQYKLIKGNIPTEYFKSQKLPDESKLKYDFEKRLEKLDAIHNELNDIKALSEKINEKISPKEFEFKLQNLISKFELKKQEKQNEIKINEKIIVSYGYLDCNTIKDFQDKKIHVKEELNKVEEEIREAGLKNKFSLLLSLQNKKAMYKTQLLEIDNIIMLLLKLESLEKDINEIKIKINELKQKLDHIQYERKQMDEFLEIYRDAKSCEDAVKLSNIKKQRIVNWIHEGRNRTNANKIYFFNKFNKIKAEKERIRRGEELRKLKTKQISRLLIHLRMGKTKSQACNIVGVNISDFNRWYEDGKNGGNDENIDFYMQVIEIKQMHKFLKEFKKNKSIKTAVNNTNISNEQINQWISDGKLSKSANAINFYNKFQKIKKQIEKTSSSTSSGTKSTVTENEPKINNYVPKNSFEKNQRKHMLNVISKMKKRYSRFEAAILCNIPISTVNKWYCQGEKLYSDNTIYFYKNVNLFEPKNNELDRMNKIIEEVKKGKSLKEAAESVNISSRLVNAWFDYGKDEFNKKTIYFYEQILNENQKEFYKMGLVLDALNKGMGKPDACKIADVPVSKLNSWIDEGRNGENKNAEYFIKEYDKLNINDDEEINLKACPNCGKLVDENHNFCNFCGYQLNPTKKKKTSIFDKIRGLF